MWRFMATRWRWSSRRWTHRRCILAFLVLLSGFTLYVQMSDVWLVRAIRFDLKSTLFGVTYRSRGWLLNTSGCTLPDFDPWMDETKHFFWKLEPERCPRHAQDVLVYLQDGFLKIDRWAKNQLEKKISRKGRWRWRKSSPKILKCHKYEIYRRPVEENDTVYRISTNFVEFDNQTAMDTEFAQVECSLNGAGRPVYRDFFYSVPYKPEVERACASNERRFLSECRLPSCRCAQLPADEPRLSVMVIGVDSVSKANFLRQFPETHALLTGSRFAAVDFRGYTKVGLNTFPCLLPYLLGQSLEEVVTGCWGGPAHFFDNCSTLWDYFSSAGYRTAFVENLAHFGLFTYNKKGFRRQVAHYYGSTLYSANVDRAGLNCWRGVADDEHVLRWSSMFQKAFADRLHFGHFWVSRFSHDDINRAQDLDPLLADHLRWMSDGQLMDATLLVVMSDHGIRFGRYRQTDVGRNEENLPFMYFVFPPWFRSKYPKAMQRLMTNGHRLVTLHDLHATLKAIVNCDYGNDDPSIVDQDSDEDTVQLAKNASTAGHQRAVSLFRSVSPLRTCSDLSIPAPYCSCRKGADLPQDVTSSASLAMAEAVLDALNALTSARRHLCELFRTRKLISVTRTSGLEENYVVVLEVAPGGARFEANVVKMSGGNGPRVHSDIRRVNRYGDSSRCITDDHFLKSVCHCKDEGFS